MESEYKYGYLFSDVNCLKYFERSGQQCDTCKFFVHEYDTTKCKLDDLRNKLGRQMLVSE